MEVKKDSALGLLPLGVFLVVYLATSLWLNDFYKMPILVAFLISAVVGFVIFPSMPFGSKVEAFSRGAGDPGIMLMILIFLLAGAFAGLGQAVGAVQSTVNFGLSHTTPNFLLAGLFLTSCFISLSLGTSVGTVVALAPIAVGINESVPGTLAIGLGAVVGGAMFGDNLSMISDTTIAATRTQGVDMREKFKVNFWIALPAALITCVIFVWVGSVPSTTAMQPGDYAIIKIFPYVFVLIGALTGLHVIYVLVLGILLTAAIGFFAGDIDGWQAASALNAGMSSMFELSITCLVIGGLVGLMRGYGAIDFVLQRISALIKTARGGELGIAALTAAVNAALANNTITILIVGPLAKTIADKHGVDLRRSASILDTISCFVQGVLPYGAQVLAALAAASYAISPLDVLRHLYYPYLLGLSTLLFITFRKRLPKYHV